MSKFVGIKALGLCSGGLDSILAALVLREQGIEVAWVSFETPFFDAAKARAAAAQTGIALQVRSITAVYLSMLRNPRCGYGQHMNPCLDCHALMFRLAGEMLAAERCAFLFSGEVLGQRPMSQTRPSLRYVEKHSGYDGLIVRPLSARLLPETEPERRGWVDRARLLNIAGRGRKRQLELAQRFGIRDYPAPAGGCLLTDRGYASRLRDLLQHEPDPCEGALHLLRYGRHFRLADGTKIIVGRTQVENDQLRRHVDSQRDALLHVEQLPGPTVVVPDWASQAVLEQAAAAAVAYSRAPKDQPVAVMVEVDGSSSRLQVKAQDLSLLRPFLL